MEQNDKIRAELLGRQLTSLLEQSGVSIVGLSHAINMSVNHLRTVKNGKSLISSRTAGKIVDFFEIDISTLFSQKIYKLRKPENISSLKKFYSDNKNNPQFFTSRIGEGSVGFFLKNELLKTDYLLVKKEVGEIRRYIVQKYKLDFNSKELSRQLNRLVEYGLLVRIDKNGNNSVFQYALSQEKTFS